MSVASPAQWKFHNVLTIIMFVTNVFLIRGRFEFPSFNYQVTQVSKCTTLI